MLVGSEYHDVKGIWDLKPYLGPWTFRVGNSKRVALRVPGVDNNQLG